MSNLTNLRPWGGSIKYGIDRYYVKKLMTLADTKDPSGALKDEVLEEYEELATLDTYKTVYYDLVKEYNLKDK